MLSTTNRRSCGWISASSCAHLAHHLLVDVQPARRVQQHHVVGLQRGLRERPPRDGERRLAGRRRRESRADLGGERLELQDGRRTVNVGADQQHLLVLLLDQPARKLAGGGGFAGALQIRRA